MKKLLVCLSVIGLVGCTSVPDLKVMPEDYYPQVSRLIVEANKCFEQDYITPATYVDFKESIAYKLTNWDYDQSKITSTIIDFNSVIHVDSSICKEAERYIGSIIVAANKDRAQTQLRTDEAHKAWQQVADALNPPRLRTTCMTTGSVTMCN